jgi:hypothetical protein
MRIRLLAAIASIGISAVANSAVAQVAVVEDVKSKTANVEFMDYVSAGKIIKLGTGERLVLGYLESCVREVITGGVVMVGAERSEVTLGEVQRTQVPCDGGPRVSQHDQRCATADGCADDRVWLGASFRGCG